MIHIVRDFGGLGDMIRIMAAVDQVGRACDDAGEGLIFHGPAEYRDLFMNHCRGMCGTIMPGKYVLTDGERWREYRGGPMLPAMRPEGQVIDFGECPGIRHERDTKGRVTKERTALFCENADVPVTPPRLMTTEKSREFRKHYRKWMDADKPSVLLHVHSAGVLRTYLKDQTQGLIKALQTKADVAFLPGTTKLSWAALIGLVDAMDLVIAVDSGIFHVAGALGKPVLGIFGPTSGYHVSSIYPTAEFIQAPPKFRCKSICYGYNERGFGEAECRGCCVNLAYLPPFNVAAKAFKMLEKITPRRTDHVHRTAE